MNAYRFLPVLVVVAPVLLAHCTLDPTHADPDNTSPTAAMTVEQPLDPATRATAWGIVGQPMTVNLYMLQTGPGTCTDYNFDGNDEECSGPNTPLAFELGSIGCDDDLCDFTQIEVGTLKDAAGNPLHGDVVTLVPKAAVVTLRATGISGALTASGSLALSVQSAH